MIVRARAPLRLGLAGGGTDLSPYCDLHGGHVLNATIDMYAHANIETRANTSVTFEAADLGVSWTGQADERLPTEGRLALHAAVHNRIVREFRAGQPVGLRMVTYCDAPPGSGLGSSSTLVVAMIKAYEEWLHLPLGEYDVAHLAFEIERKDLGLAGGKQDQYAATFGGFNFMEFYDNDRVIVNPLRVKNWILSELEASLVLFYTGVSRASAEIIEQQTRNVAEGDQRSINAMHDLKHDALAMKEAVLKGDFHCFAECMGKSWEAKKKTAADISNPSIETAFSAALEAGALAGKVSGAGGGGFIMFMVDPARRPAVGRALARSGGQVVPFHFTKHGTQGWTLG
jgi:D-glycero-alpha-D-manno-heptose-7-phosphate kinase